jgi:hypothetical protein
MAARAAGFQRSKRGRPLAGPSQERQGNGDGPRLFCRTHFITRNRERFKTVRKAVIAAVGKAKAMDLCLTARMMDATEAEKSGLVARVIPADQLLDETLKAAAVIAGFSLPVVMMVKEADNRAFESSLNEGLLFERRAFHAEGEHKRRVGCRRPAAGVPRTTPVRSERWTRNKSGTAGGDAQGRLAFSRRCGAPVVARRRPAFPRPRHQPPRARCARRSHPAGGGEDRPPGADDLPLDRPWPDLAGSDEAAGLRPGHGRPRRAQRRPYLLAGAGARQRARRLVRRHLAAGPVPLRRWRRHLDAVLVHQRRSALPRVVRHGAGRHA